jgi:hypothetical protein
MRRSTWILLLVFALLVIFAWVFTRYKRNTPAETTTPTAQPTSEGVYTLTNLQVSELMITDRAGESIDLYRDSSTSNNWAIRDMPVDQADKVGIETAISQLLSIQVIDSLTDAPPLDTIGLATPAYTMTIVTVDGSQIVTYVGNKNAIGTGYYIRVDSGPVVIVNNLTLDDLLGYIQKPPLLPTPTPEVTATESGTPIAPQIQDTPTP